MGGSEPHVNLGLAANEMELPTPDEKLDLPQRKAPNFLC